MPQISDTHLKSRVQNNDNTIISDLYLLDCVEGMKHYPDKHFDLSICDPPYGIKESLKKRPNHASKLWPNPTLKMHNTKDWDKHSPATEYFDELFRVSKNQIIWGANHFISSMPYNSSCWIVWDKKNGNNDFADCELAWASFNTSVRKFEWLWNGFLKQSPEKRIHPTQKPVALYEWLLSKYAKPNDTILDTHVGSGSSRIACYNANHSFVGFEIDQDYVDASDLRFRQHIAQQLITYK